MGGISDSDQISYSTNIDQIDQDSSFNDWLTISHDHLAWDPGGFVNMSENKDSGMSHEEGARYLWDQFVKSLEQG